MKGSLITFTALDCGHPVQCYSLEPTPTTCVDCLSAGWKVLARCVGEFRDVDRAADELLSQDNLEDYLDECEVTDPEMRKDFARLAELGDDIRNALDYAERFGRTLLEKYPKAVTHK